MTAVEPRVGIADRALLGELEDGLPLVSRPYRALGEKLGVAEDEVIARLERLIDCGVIKRFGVVVSHRALGYTANAMVVWDIPDPAVEAAAKGITTFPFVTLCYRRPRREGWPFNVFCMIHGRDRQTVLEQIDEVRAFLGAKVRDHAVLFSTRAFKQRGARYGAARAGDAA